MLECVVNISEGRQLSTIELIGRTAGHELLDLHRDADHNRSVLTLIGEDAARAVTAATVLALDLRHHVGAHPRMGVVDVVPFVALGSASLDDAIAAREAFMTWASANLGVPCFRYGPERTLPDLRRHAFEDWAPDTGPDLAHPTAGAIAVGARPPLVAYNLWLETPDLDRARAVASSIRGPHVRALGLEVGDHVQVSMNLIDPMTVGPRDIFERVSDAVTVARAELVGLIPSEVLDRVPTSEWSRLGLSEDQTIEHRLAVGGWTVD